MAAGRRVLVLALALAPAAGCDRCRGEPAPITPRPSYDARPPRDPDAPPTWSAAGSVLAPELGPAVRGFPLPFGRVLVWKTEPEVFDSHGNVWKKTAPRPPCADVPGGFVRLARIPDEIVFAVGATCGYDAEHDSWVKVPVFDVHGSGWAVTQLAKGHVLVTGGGDASSPRNEALRWDSDEKKVSVLTLVEARAGHEALRLLDDTVLITAATAGQRMQLFVPSTLTLRPLGVQEYGGDVLLLEDGRVAFLTPDRCGLYDPSSTTWLKCPPMNTPRVPGTYTVTAIRDDRILVLGGRTTKDPTRATDGAEVYDPHDDVWLDAFSMPVAREGHVAVPMLDGRVLVAGGSGWSGPVAEAFYYAPDPPPAPPPMLPEVDAAP